MLCGREMTGEKFALLWLIVATTFRFSGWFNLHQRRQAIPHSGTFNYRATDQGLALMKGHKDDEEPDKQDCLNVLAIVDSAFSKINAGTDMYRATAKPKSPTNQRREKQGKPPLIYDWHTVALPAMSKGGQGLVGTHASPRRHERRGHWRTCANGKRVWVRNCTVGDASRARFSGLQSWRRRDGNAS